MEAVSLNLAEHQQRAPFAELARPIVFQRPLNVAPPFPWAGHIPFAFWLIDALRPRVTVELGTHSGNSYFALCQAIEQCQIQGASAFAVDTWKGDPHAGFYGEEIFERVSEVNKQYGFSSLVRATFDEALGQFADRSIDLLHIDGLHTYEAVKHDFESWLPKLSERAVVLFHDTNVWERDFGVWKLWAELQERYPSIELKQSHGLGVLAVGTKPAERVRWLCGLRSKSSQDVLAAQEFFSFIGNLLKENLEANVAIAAPAPAPAPAVVAPVDLGTIEQHASIMAVANNQTDIMVEYERTVAQLRTELDHARRLGPLLASERAQLASVHEWSLQFLRRLSLARSGRAWSIMKSLTRAQALLVRKEDEGPRGFVRYVIAKLLRRRYPLTRSYDPFEGLPPYPLAGGTACDDDVEEAATPLLGTPEVLFDGGRQSAHCDVVIPVHGAIHWLELCLRALLIEENAALLSSVILVDDGSTPEELERMLTLAKRYERVSVIKNSGPRGFGAACNAGALFSTSPHILFLNSDCLVGPHTVSSLIGVLERERALGMVCPVANSAANLSMDIPSGRSFIELDRTLAREAAGRSLTHDACTVVGHCLLINKKCWTATGGFDLSWGRGYGEESDLQLRAEKHGWYAAVTGDTFVYHFGGGTFGMIARERAALQTRNHRRFMKLWGNEYRKLQGRSQGRDVVREAEMRLQSALNPEQKIDVLFVLPGVRQDVGGLHAVIEIVNELILSGIEARAIIVGTLTDEQLASYREAMLFKPYVAANEDELLRMSMLKPRVVVATLFSTAAPASRFAKRLGAKLVNFVQGYEIYFDNARWFNEAREALALGSDAVVTSEWLRSKIANLLPPQARLTKLCLGTNPSLFFPRKLSSAAGRLRVMVVIRNSPDKGQWVLAEFADLLGKYREKFCLTVVSPEGQPVPLCPEWMGDPDTRTLKLPAAKFELARELRASDILVDASFHEGFGLVPLEAMTSGCVVVTSDSGGVNEFLVNGENGILIPEVNKPEKYLAAVLGLEHDRQQLLNMRERGLRKASEFESSKSFAGYREFFARLLER